jgi:hypothetical protein
MYNTDIFNTIDMVTKKTHLGESMKKLDAIVKWFDAQEEVDVELGLEKIKEGAVLIKASKARLKEVENEFEEVKKDLESA